MKFYYYRKSRSLIEAKRAVTIGAFDGLHLGHQKLLLRNNEVAVESAEPLIRTLVTFEPLPTEVLPGRGKSRVMSLREKLYYLRESKLLDEVIVLPFNSYWSKVTHDDFLYRFLLEECKLSTLTIGADFRFGYKARGDYYYLQEASDDLGFTLNRVPYYLVDGERVSSTRVRGALNSSMFDFVERLLGRRYIMGGKVVTGNKLARTLGTPTINIKIDRKSLPLHGVFNVKARNCNTGREYLGVANVGYRPTVNESKPSLEVHLHNTDENLYGATFSVEFMGKIREEQKFSGIDELKEQIYRDIEASKSFFNI